jgi:ABC-type multidrug transport system fused ATPase/permease subunit
MQALVDQVLEPKCKPGLLSASKVLLIWDCPNDEDEASSLLIAIMLLLTVPFALVHFVDYWGIYCEIGGPGLLQVNLLRKFLGYSEDTRRVLKSGNLLMAVDCDAPDLCNHGHAKVFPLLFSVSRLVLIVVLQMGTATWRAILPNLLFPPILLACLKMRWRRTTSSVKRLNCSWDDFTTFVQDTERNARLIIDYRRNHEVVDEFQKLIDILKFRVQKAEAIKANNKYVASWLTTIIVGLWIVIGGKMVIDPDDPETLGSFLMTLGIFQEVGNQWSTIHGTVISINSAIVPLQRLMTLLNMETDLKDRMHVSNLRVNTLRDKLVRVWGTKAVHAYAVDTLPIKLQNVSYSYSVKAFSLNSLHQFNVEFPQGSLVAVVGAQKHGKATLLKLIGGVLIPQAGFVSVPSHLRILHVSQQPLFFHGSLLKNLMYGQPFIIKKDNKHEDETGIPRSRNSSDYSIAGHSTVRTRHHSQDSTASHSTVPTRRGSHDSTAGHSGKRHSHKKHDSAAKQRVFEICQLLEVPEHLHYLLDEDERDDDIYNWNEMLSLSTRAQLNLARALVNNPHVLVLHLPTKYLNQSLAANAFKVLRKFVDLRGLRVESEDTHMASINYQPRPRTCFFTTTSPIGTSVADMVLEVNSGKLTSCDSSKLTAQRAVLFE